MPSSSKCLDKDTYQKKKVKTKMYENIHVHYQTQIYELKYQTVFISI